MAKPENNTSFEYALTRQFSEAQTIANIAMDPGQAGVIKDQYPPVLTPGDFVAQMIIRTDEWREVYKSEHQVATHLQARLVQWTQEGFFELVPVPREIDNIGFKLTFKGLETALKTLKTRVADTKTFISLVEDKAAKAV